MQGGSGLAGEGHASLGYHRQREICVTRRQLLWMGSAAANAQEARFRSDVQLVNVTFSARRPNGALLTDLTKDEVEVWEDGVKQKVQFFARTSDLPLAIGLIVDASSSQQKFFKDQRRDVQRFLKNVMKKDDRAFLVFFGNNLRMVTDLTGSVEDIVDGMQGFGKEGRTYPMLGPRELRFAGTAFYDAIYYSSRERLAQISPGRRVLMVFSDGEDNSSAHHMIEAIEAAQAADALIYAIRYTEIKRGLVTARNKYGTSVMKRIAAESGGLEYDAEALDMKKVFQEIGDELHNLYEVGYLSANVERDGTFRKVVLKTSRPEVKLRAKPGYYAR